MQGKTRIGARITFDLSEPTVIGDARFDKGGRELTLQLQAASAATFAAAAAAGTGPGAAAAGAVLGPSAYVASIVVR